MVDTKTDRLVHPREAKFRLGADAHNDEQTAESAAPHRVVTSVAHAGVGISFGPFGLAAGERLLTRDGAPVELGGRTFDLLTALVSRPSEVVSKRDLLAQVWPNVNVEEGNLRLHIANLRKVLGDGKDGARYIATVPGRGYAFVAPVARKDNMRAPAAVSSGLPPTNLPHRLVRMIGRTDEALMLSGQLATVRFVTIVGAGGVGKTTVAMAVAHELIEAFSGAVLFVDLGALRDPKLVAASIASMLGLSVQSDDAAPSLIAHLREKRILLILDTCEHLIEEVSALAELIFASAQQVHILATSREALRVEGEHVFNLAPLAYPPDVPGFTAAALQKFPATQLFLERAAASGSRLDLSDADAATVACICRKLDGVPLAIELAAGRVEAYGLQQTAALLDRRLTMVGLGQRSAPPRQRTLQATLEWSFGLLTELERTVLCRLAVFAGPFTLEAALTVVTSPSIDQALVFGAIDSLLAKSMVAIRPVGAMMCYQLLDMTRAYAGQIYRDDVELADLATRHARYHRQWLERIATEPLTLSEASERIPLLIGLNNVRGALDWCFGAGGNVDLGIGLAAAAAPVFLTMSLLSECHRWSERALLALDAAARGGREEMLLQAALGVSLMFSRGNSEAARVALSRSLAIAEQHHDLSNQLQMLSRLYMFHLRIGDFRTALEYARRNSTVSKITEDEVEIASAHSCLGVMLHVTGNLCGACAELRAALRYGPRPQLTTRINIDADHYAMAGIALARNLWLQGHPDQAVEQVRKTVEAAARVDHPVTLAIALNWAVSVFLWIGCLQRAEEHLDRFIAHAKSHSMAPSLAAGRGWQGQLSIRRGDARNGVDSLQSALADLHAVRYELLTTTFDISLVQGLAAICRFNEGITLINDTIQRVEANGDLSFMPELLRVKGGLLLLRRQPDNDETKECLVQSLDLSRRQGASAWELRTAFDLAALLNAEGRGEAARAVLQPVFEKFTEGLETTDLKAAKDLLVTLPDAFRS